MAINPERPFPDFDPIPEEPVLPSLAELETEAEPIGVDMARFTIGTEEVKDRSAVYDRLGETGRRLVDLYLPVMKEEDRNRLHFTLHAADQLLVELEIERNRGKDTLEVHLDESGRKKEEAKPIGKRHYWLRPEEVTIYHRPDPQSEPHVPDREHVMIGKPVVTAVTDDKFTYIVVAEKSGELTWIIDDGQRAKKGDDLFSIK